MSILYCTNIYIYLYIFICIYLCLYVEYIEHIDVYNTQTLAIRIRIVNCLYGKSQKAFHITAF